jgi:LacI family transcriptional regulator
MNNIARANISEETRQRVLQAADLLGYVPDAAARSLARGHSNNIALVITQPHDQVFQDIYVPNVLNGITQVFRERGMHVIVELTDDLSHSETCLNLIRGREVAGLLLQPYAPSEADAQVLRTAAQDGFPMVTLSTLLALPYSVTIRQMAGVAHAVDHLVSLGHRRIGCVTYSPIAPNPHMGLRLNVYRERLLAHNIAVDEALIQYGDYEAETGYAAAVALLRADPPPTAILAMNDVMAFGVLAALRERDVRVPEEVAVIGHDDIPLARYAHPPLTTIRAPEVAHGRRAGEMLLSLIERKPPEIAHLELDTTLIIRQSCGYHLRNI